MKKIFEKNLTMPKKTEREPFGNFQHPFCRKTSKKLKEGPFGEKNFPEKKSRNAEKTERGTLWSRPVL